MTDKRLPSVRFFEDDSAKVIQSLDTNKAHGHDNISMLKCLFLLFTNLIQTMY